MDSMSTVNCAAVGTRPASSAASSRASAPCSRRAVQARPTFFAASSCILAGRTGHLLPLQCSQMFATCFPQSSQVQLRELS